MPANFVLPRASLLGGPFLEITTSTVTVTKNRPSGSRANTTMGGVRPADSRGAIPTHCERRGILARCWGAIHEILAGCVVTRPGRVPALEADGHWLSSGRYT